MQYNKFFLENYKGIQDKIEFSLDLNSKLPYCIIGNNECG